MALNNRALLETLSADRALASAMVFPHRHPQASPAFHVEVMDAWRSADEFLLIEAFREAGKSTLAEEFLCLEAAYGNFWYCLVIGETYTKACQRLEAIKYEATHNMKLLNLFGRLQGSTWNENKAEFSNGALIEAMGWEQEFRSMKHRDRRPDRAYCDDIENRERVRDSAAVDVTMRKLYMQLIPAMDKERRKIRWTGTPLAPDCAVVRLRNDPSWAHLSFPIASGDLDDPATEATWAARYPMPWIRAERDRYSRAGMLREFMQEYMLVAEGEGGKPFAPELLVESMEPAASWMPRRIIVDPARTSDPTSSAMTGWVAVSRVGTRIYVHASGGAYWKPDETVTGALDLVDKYGAADLNIERNSLDDWLMQPMRAEILRRGRAYQVNAILAPREMSKGQFIMGLQPFLKAREIILVGGKVAHPQLVSQLTNFPLGKIDVLNALAYVLRVFAGRPVYEDDFSPEILARHLEPSQAAQLVLAVNSTAQEIAAALVSVEGRRLLVLADWVSSLPARDAIADILAVVKAAYPNRRLTVWVPAEVLEQSTRNPLALALVASKLVANRGPHAATSRGALSPYIRLTVQGRRALLVDPRARNTAIGMAGGYCYALRPDGAPLSEPERGPYRTLLEALECLTGALEVAHDSALPEGAYMGTNAQGQTYMTALPRR